MSEHIERLRLYAKSLNDKKDTARLNREQKEMLARRSEDIKNKEIAKKEEESHLKSSTEIKVSEIQKEGEIEAITTQGKVNYYLAEQQQQHIGVNREADFINEVSLRNGDYNFQLSKGRQQIAGRLKEVNVVEGTKYKIADLQAKKDLLEVKIKEAGATERTQIIEGTKYTIAQLQAEKELTIKQMEGLLSLKKQGKENEQERYILAEKNQHELVRINVETASFLRKEKDKRKTHRKNAFVDMAVATHQTNLNIYERIILMLAEKKIFGGRQNAEQTQAVEDIVKENVERWEQELKK